ncbi:MAG: Ig-like domain-containing protein, partial [Gammaproteobacteria bacterium]|nr:Ig-like domain-containing protein [Gammaproteobacteria bacterium]
MITPKRSLYLLLTALISILQITCDDRVTEEENTKNYTLIIESNPVSEFVPVGEDVAGSEAETAIIITLLDANKTPVKDAIIALSAMRDSQTAGSINTSPTTNKQGQATVYFYDSGMAIDDPSTGIYEGVTVRAVYGSQSATTRFNVYKDRQSVWPYQMTITSNNTEIQLDNGTTFANITLKLTNQFNSEVKNAPVVISTDKGIVVSQTTGLVINEISTDSTGVGSVIFKDRNMQSDIGTANIVYNFYHPGFEENTTDTIKIVIGTDYNISITSTPVALSDNMGEVVVGEDITGIISKTRLSVTITDANDSPKSGITVPMQAMVLGQEVNSLIIVSNVTNNAGTIYAYFEDQDVVYQDNHSTLDYEGVTATAYLGDSTGSSASVLFEVFPQTVWPYQFFLSTDVDEILLDNGETVAIIEARILNQLNMPVKNLNISFSSNKGYIESQGTTDSTGTVQLTFTDNGEQEDIGLANISASYTHPGFDSTLTDLVEVLIISSNILTLESYPISYDSGGNANLVGEDIQGEISLTRLVARVSDSAGNPLSGQLINFNAGSLGQSVGSFSVTSGVSNTQGYLYSYFDDGNNTYQDISGTVEYEGVTATAYLGDST